MIEMSLIAALELYPRHPLYKKEMSNDRKDYLTVPRLEAIPFVVHGFGTKHLAEGDFERKAELAQFKRLFLKQTHSDIVRSIRADY